ncbi:DUF4347 domain-containing protein [Comamonas jiangduensis]|uniref:DUF4347 domain-containing protein n=1 Tax=Comamonas jiangduensis TaxID=1194168 RepID=UPI0028AE00BB|nr:DUF4347 domain-containing protein [Comamonas jiangduensis]
MTAHNRPFWRRLAQAAAKPATAGGAESAHTAPAGLVSAMRPLALEQRFMFDGAGVADAAHAVADGATATDAATDTAGALRHALMAEAAPATSQRQEVVFVDSQVANLGELLAGLSSSAEVVIMDASKDGLQQMADYLQGRSGLDAIHLLSHGADGTVQMGNVWLSSANLAEHSAALQGIGAALKADGDLLLYGCDVGQGDKGQSFLELLAAITGADVAASVDDTGAAALGGNWTLERTSGVIETTALGAQLQGYEGLLAVSFSGGLNNTGPTLGVGELSRMVIGDFNNDGRDDILYQTGGDNTPWRFAAGNVGGTFTTVDKAQSPFASVAMENGLTNGVNYYAADFDKDGDTDLLAVVSNGAAYLYRNNNGVFAKETASTFLGTQYGGRLVVGDFDGDGAADILYQPGSVDTNYTWRYAKNNGDGTFTDVPQAQSPFAAFTLGSYSAFNYRVLDFDGDGDLDIMWTANNNKGTLYINNGGTFTLGSTTGFPTPAYGGRTLWGDFDGDGDADVLWQIGTNDTEWNYGLNNGDGTFTTIARAGSPFAGLAFVDFPNSNFRTGDFDGDGDLDVIGIGPDGSSYLYIQSGQSPRLVSATPADNSLNVSPGANIVLTFSESVAKGTGNIYIVSTSNGQVVQTIPVTSGQVTGSGTTWTIDPSDLAQGTAYAVRIDSKTFRNGDGKIYAGIQNNTALNFTTATVQVPVIANLHGDSVNYTEDAAFTLLDLNGNATVSDADSSNFNGGKLTVQVTAGGTAGEDVLFIRNEGNGANQIEVDGFSIKYNSLEIGTYTGGTSGAALVITLTNNANATTTAALLHNLAYRNSNTIQPSTTARTVSISMDDGAGGNSAVSVVTVAVLAANDAPVVNVTGTNPTYTENGSAVVLFSGTTINNVETGQFVKQMVFTVSSLADGSLERLTIDGSEINLVNGTNLVTLNNSTTVTVSLAAGTATVTLTHSGLATSTAQTIVNNITYRNFSEAPTGISRVVTLSSVTDNGGTANGGTDTATPGVTSTVTLVSVNDAPTLSGSPYVMTGINEDIVSPGYPVSSILGGVTYGDVDPGYLSGIAVTSTVGRGTWQYSTDGNTWTDFGAVSSTSALLLSSTTQVRYVPDAANGESVSMTFRAWDRTTGTASTAGVRSTADTTSNGGSTAFSVGTAQATLAVSSVNDAPVMLPVAPTLSGLTDTSTNNGGNTVLSLLGGVTDVDNGALKGMAITGVTGTYGTWQYSIDGGGTWSNVGAVSVTSALVLASQNLVRFVPDGIHGETATITYKAWDQTGGTAGLQGVKFDTTTSGGTSPYSAATDTASVVVTAINDAPTLNGSAGNATWTEGNNTTSIPVVIDSGLTITDADGPLIASATVRVSGNYSNGQDYLELISNPATMGNVTASWDATNGTLTLTSAGNQATMAQFQAALRAVTYTNLSDAPSTSARTVQFQVNDGSLDSSAVSRNIIIIAVDDSPVITAPASTMVVEDVASVISLISVSDPDSSSGTVTLSVGSGSLSATSAAGVTVGGTSSVLTLSGTLAAINSFIANNGLTYTTAANATADVTLTIAVDTGSVSPDTKTMTLTVSPVNDAPVVTVPGSINVTEDLPGYITGVSFSDVDAGSGNVTATFSVTSGNLTATGANNVVVGGSGTDLLTLTGTVSDINAFIAGSNLSYKTALNATASVTLAVALNDNGNTGGSPQSDTKSVTISVTAVNDAPVNSVPASQTAQQGIPLAFNDANGNAISISDVDAGSSLMMVNLSAINGTLSLGSTSGVTLMIGTGTDSSVIGLMGSQANINAVLQTLTFKPNTGFLGNASLTIQSNDQSNSGSGGAKTDIDTIAISVVPVNPKVNSVSAQGLDRTVKIGDAVLVSVVFDQAVHVDLSGGVPSLLLETGLLDRNAVYQSGSGSNTLVFKYTVQAGDVSADLDFQSTAALQLNGAVMANAASDLAILTLPTVGGSDSLGGRSNIVVDGVVPVVASVSVPSDGTYITGQNLDFTVNFSENVIVDSSGGVPRIAVTLDSGGTVYADYVSGSGGSALVFRLTVASGQLDSNGITLGGTVQLNGGSIRDGAGNDTVVALNSVASTANVNVDGVVPAVVSVNTPSDGHYKAGDVLTFTVNASEALQTGALPPRLVLDVGGVTRYATYVSGNGSNALVFQYIVQAGDADPNGIAVSSIDLRGEQLTDLAGNDLDLTLNGVGSTAGVLVDTTAPSAGNIVRVGSNPSNSGSVSFTVTFSEDVSGVDASDFNLVFGGSAAGSISSVTAVDRHTYTVVVGGLTGTGSLRLDLNNSGTGIVDSAGNAISSGLTGATYGIDREAPSVTSVDVPAHGTYLAGQNLDFTVHLDEAVYLNTVGGTPRIEVILDNGTTAYATYLSGTGSNALVFRLTVANGQLDTNGITLGSGLQLNGATLLDGTGNDANIALNGVGDTSQVRIDAVVPVVRLVSVPADGSYKAGDVLTFTVNASEAVLAGALAPHLVLDVGGVTRYATYVSGSGSAALVFQYTVQAGDNDSDGIAVNNLDLRGEQLTDLAGNDLDLTLHGVGNTVGVMVDNVAPTAQLFLDKTTLNAQETAQLTVRFSEAVTGLDVTDFTVTDGHLSALTSTDGGITWTATLTPAPGTVRANLRVILNNAGYTDRAGNAGIHTSVSDSYAIDTVLPAQPVLQVESNAEGNATVRVDALDAGVQWEYSLDAGQTWQAGQGNVIAIASPGQYMLQVRQTSAAGNQSAVAALTVDVAPLAVLPTVEWPVAGIFGNSGIWEIAVPSTGGVPFGILGTDPVTPRGNGAFLGNDGAPSGPSTTSPFFSADVATDRGELSLGFLGFGPRSIDDVPGAPAPLGMTVLPGAGAERLVLLHSVEAVVADTGRQVDWKVPPTMFGHTDPLASVQFAMTQADGRPLPAWLKFDARTGQISGTMPPGFQGELTLRLTARDSQGHAVSTVIKLKAGDAGPAARTGMAEQLQRHAQLRAGQLAAQRLHL